MDETILLIEDETSIADNVIYALKSDNFNTHWFNLGNQGLEFLNNNPVNLVILDVGLPDINGFELCKIIRQSSDVPIIFLTARESEIDRVVGLEIGGDDYVVKPFSPRELVARVKAILRRRTRQNMKTTELDSASSCLFKVDTHRRKISFCGEVMKLTAYQFGVLALLLSQPERVFSREQLMDAVWSTEQASFDRSVDTTIKQIRAKLKAIDCRLQPLTTHRGVGYSIEKT